MKVLLKNNEDLIFQLNERAKCWMSSGLINSVNVDFEIYEDRYIQESIDWEYFQDFVYSLERNNILPDLIIKSQKVLLSLADVFGASIGENEKMEDFKMDFVGLSFQGKSESLFSTSYSYSLWFVIVNKYNINAYVDPYGAFITDIEGRIIVGAKREQC